MIKQATGTGKTVEEAMAAAKAQLGINDGDDFEITDIQQPHKKTLGIFGGSPAKVTLSVGKEDKPAKPQKAAKPAKQEKPAQANKSAKQEKPRRPLPPEKQSSADASVSADDETVMTELTEGSEEYTVLVPTISYLSDVLAKMGVQGVRTTAYKTADGYELAFDGKGLGVAIGRKGDTLDSLQHLCSLIANREHEDYLRITLNPGGYREKRRKTLCELAERTAKKALEKDRNYALEPMNAYERRIIHNAVQPIEGVMSWSVGENDRRRVIIGTSMDQRSYRADSRSGGYRGGRSDRRGGGRNDRRGGRRNDRPQYSQAPTREPRKDTADLPLYGIIK